MDSEISNMELQHQETKPKETQISFKFQNSFFCFFDDYLTQNSITFTQCFQHLFHSHQSMKELTLPLPKLLQHNEMNFQNKVGQLEHRSHQGVGHFFFYPNQNKKGYVFEEIANSESQEKEVSDMGRELSKLKKENQELMMVKKEQIRREKERQQEEIKKRNQIMQGSKEKITTKNDL